MSISKALVTGGTGFVGSAIVEALLEQHRECDITVLDVNLPKAAASLAPDVQYIQGDITNLDDTVGIVQAIAPNVIIHTAGVVPSLAARFDRKEQAVTYQVNFVGTRNMLVAAKAADVGVFVYTSSCTVVTDDLTHHYPNVDETVPAVRQSLIYGESKTAAEALVLAASDEKLATCALRPSVLMGPGGPQLISSIHACIAKGETPFIIGNGENLWDITYVSNIADAHVLAAENLLTTRTAAGEAFFISNDEPVPFRDFCLAVWAHFGHIPPYQLRVPANLAWAAGYAAEWFTWFTGTPATLSRGSVKDACAIRYANGEKARKILGYKPRIGVVEGVRLSCEDYVRCLRERSVDSIAKADEVSMRDGCVDSNGDIENTEYRATNGSGTYGGASWRLGDGGLGTPP
ncbi:MAG: hypothetical protein M1827_000647 [Pycnora praestabilis]|nr:MAG: hypothetical protein M1827_000647 [Pycnora praestabilis]